MFETKITLRKEFFTDKEQLLVEHGALSVSTFRYSSGVEGLTLRGRHGYITVLPYKGHQIWRAEFLDHPMVMKTLFDEPQQTDEFLKTYGAFLIHCGLTAIGNPSAEDTHPLHGELPNARYQKSFVIVGEDERGKYIELQGQFQYCIGFEVGYRFIPTYRLYEDETHFHVKNRIVNLRGVEQEYLYLCHINFRPIDGSKLVYSAKTEDIYTHVLIPDNLAAADQEKLRRYFDILEKDVHAHDTIGGKDQFYQPEIVFTVKYQKDEQGRGYCMQQLPDGYSFCVSHYPDQLPYGIRWISRMENEDALGMLLPATGEHNGYKDCVEKGFIRYMPADEDVVLEFDVGVGDPQQTKAWAQKIEEMIK